MTKDNKVSRAWAMIEKAEDCLTEINLEGNNIFKANITSNDENKIWENHMHWAISDLCNRIHIAIINFERELEK